MSILYKVFWAIRALFYGLIFGKFAFPGYVGKPIFLYGIRRAYISKRVRIFPGMRMEIHGEGKLFIEENISIGQNFHVTCRGNLTIKSGTLISGDVLITDIDHEYEEINKPIFCQGHKLSRTEIGENCFIGMGARIQAGTVLGRQCIVGANSVVRGTFPDYCVIAGVPAKIIKRYNFETESWERMKTNEN